MCKNSIWNLINSNINKRDERDSANGLYWVCTHSSNTDGENMNVFFFFSHSKRHIQSAYKTRPSVTTQLFFIIMQLVETLLGSNQRMTTKE